MNENKRPLVSIMIITYNQEEFIAETIESCLSQTYENIEIIVGDDASKDRTPSILMEYKNKYPEKIKLFLNKKNVGITRNFNNILKECKGKYIAWLGGDDRFLPTKIEKQVKYLENNSDKIICYHSVRTFRNKTEETLGYMPRKDTSKYVDTDSLVREGCFLGGCSVMHRNIGLLCDEDIPIASDWLYWIELSYKGDLGYIDEVLSEYRRHEMNITQNTKLDTIYKEQLLTLQKVKAENLKDSNSLFIGKIRVELMLCTLCLRSEDYKKSLSYLENINFKKLGYFNKIFLLKILLKFRLGKILKKYFMNRTKY